MSLSINGWGVVATLAAARTTVTVAAIGFAGLLSPGKLQHF
jgi:hypothetical protein